MSTKTIGILYALCAICDAISATLNIIKGREILGVLGGILAIAFAALSAIYLSKHAPE